MTESHRGSCAQRGVGSISWILGASLLPMDGRPASFVALILAAGEGRRLGSTTPKPWIKLEGEPLLAWSLRRLEELPGHLGSLVAMDQESLDTRWPSLAERGEAPRIGILGGATRQESARKAFEALETHEESWTPPEVVLVHDAARPFFPQEPTKQLIQRAREIGGALLGFPVRDTLKACDENRRVLSTVPREHLYAAATPQAFARATFGDMLREAATQGIQGTDEAMLAESMGVPLEIVPCPSSNLKVTYPEDLRLLPCLAPLLHEGRSS